VVAVVSVAVFSVGVVIPVVAVVSVGVGGVPVGLPTWASPFMCESIPSLVRRERIEMGDECPCCKRRTDEYLRL
jgi:hypothetical protein